MNPSDLAELRTMYVFSPLDGETWGLTFEGFRSHLLARNPEEFLRVDEGRAGPVRGSTLHFGITFGDEVLEGFVALTPEGVAITDCTALEAANFVVWLRDEVVPQDKVIAFNTEWGIEEQVQDAPVPEVTRPRLVAAFLAHIEETGLE
ncbi:hypothetical protein [Streptomyces sp. XY332]|uniref:hypothetical protein n=1 Tax=Streptomyces sp. XY332 TaxID=1415561 RepID=UPI0006B17699|nr:hypothetical protein [Streptomyces sp. XY332]KOY59125.1 hypothetical protein ADK59_04865 [Streptomyces sp. XY332]